MLPLLKFLSDGQERQLKEAVQALALEFKLTQAELSELLPSGSQPIFLNRVGWAKSYLKKAGLIEYPRRSYCKITPLGTEALEKSPSRITIKFLEQFPGFQEFRTKHSDEVGEITGNAATEAPANGTPRESLESAYQQLRAELASDIAQALKSSDPAKFERIVVELLVRMGYGGNLIDAGRAIGRSGDEGIDGVIKEDHLGLDNIYVQAKKWEGTVGRPEIQKFAGALQGQRARKGVFITTSEFSREARSYVQNIEVRIVLIDGKTLCDLMMDFNVGVSPVENFELKRIDLDFFSED